jgi:predicted Zn-dependent protease with MMP-like domain
MLAFAIAMLSSGSAAAASPSSKSRSVARHQCVNYPNQGATIGSRGGTNGVGGVDVSGCTSWIYEALPVLVPPSFFGGNSFRPGISAYEYGSVETTQIDDGRQVDVVQNPTPTWKTAYRGFDNCATASSGSGAQVETCTVSAVRRYSGGWLWDISIAAVLVALLLFLLHHARPAGPIRRRRRFRRLHNPLATAVEHEKSAALRPGELRRLRRRLRRLERVLSPGLSETQHQWFASHLASGRHGLALESLARWIAEAREPLPKHLRDEFEWLAESLRIEHLVIPVLEVHVQRGAAEVQSVPAKAQDGAGGLDVSLSEFRRLVADAIDGLPAEFQRAMDNVAITVEDVADAKIADGRELFGVYIGTPLTKRRLWNVHPDKIIIYRATICAYCDSIEQVRAEVYRTVIHEIAHHFGIGDPALEALGW